MTNYLQEFCPPQNSVHYHSLTAVTFLSLSFGRSEIVSRKPRQSYISSRLEDLPDIELSITLLGFRQRFRYPRIRCREPICPQPRNYDTCSIGVESNVTQGL